MELLKWVISIILVFWDTHCSQHILLTNLALDPFSNSSILSSESRNLTKKLEEWLPRQETWHICWRATRDGWNSQTFHSKCDDKPRTLVIVKVVRDSKKFVFGAFSSVPWAGYSYTSAPGSFLFSLHNNDDLAPFKAPLKNENDEKAIYRHTGYSPTFGDGATVGGTSHDLYISNDAGSSSYSLSYFGHNYQLPDGYTAGETNTKLLLAGSYTFTPLEIEVLY